jgi:hypothetical protein
VQPKKKELLEEKLPWETCLSSIFLSMSEIDINKRIAWQSILQRLVTSVCLGDTFLLGCQSLEIGGKELWPGSPSPTRLLKKQEGGQGPGLCLAVGVMVDCASCEVPCVVQELQL